MGFENRPAPKPKVASLPKNLPEVRVQSDNPDDVRDLEKKQAAKKVLASLPSVDKPVTDTGSLTKIKESVAKPITKIPESNKTPKTASKEKGETHNVKSLTPEQKKKQADLMAMFTDINVDEKDPMKNVVIAGTEEQDIIGRGVTDKEREIAKKLERGPSSTA